MSVAILIGICLLVPQAAGLAKAGIVFSDFGSSDADENWFVNGGYGILGANSSPPNMSHYFLFTPTESGDVVALRVAVVPMSARSSGNLVAEIYSNVSFDNTPGTLLGSYSIPAAASFDPPAPPPVPEWFRTNSTVHLTAGTDYWMYFRAESAGGEFIVAANGIGLYKKDIVRDSTSSYPGLSKTAAFELATTMVPEIDPASGARSLSLIAGFIAIIEQRRRRGVVVSAVGPSGLPSKS